MPIRKHIDGDGGKPGSLVGSDMCNLFTSFIYVTRLTNVLGLGGVIQDIGADVSTSWREGDRIAAFVHGGNDTHPEDGTGALSAG